MCACKMFHGPGTRDAQSVHRSTSTLKVNNRLRLPFAAWVGSWSRVDLPLLQPAREGAVISLDFLQKNAASLLFPPRTGLPGHYICHAISTTGATLLLPRPGIGHRTRQDCHLQLPPSFPFPSPHTPVFTSHSSTTGHWCTPTTIEALATRFAAR